MNVLLRVLITYIIFSGCFNVFASTCQENLTLDKALTIVKSNHPVIKMAIVSSKIADSKLIEAQGAFDLKLSSSAYYNRYNSSSEIGEPQYTKMYNAELEMLTRYGLLIKSGFNLNDGDIKTPISPTGNDGEYFISINAPMLRGANLNSISVQETRAKYNIQKVYNNYRLVGLDLLLKTIETYWKWVALKHKLNIEKKLLSLSEFRLDGITSRAKNGDLASIDIVEVKQEIQRRKSRVIKAERNYQKVSFELSWFLWDKKNNTTKVVIDCESSDFKIKMIDIKKYNADNGKILALKNRPEIKDLEISKMVAQLEKEFAANDLLPKLDIALKTGKQFGNGSINGHLVEGGVEFELPLQQREARGRFLNFERELDNIDLQKKNIMQKIFLQVEDAFSAINMSIKNLQAIADEVRLAEKMESGENKKFNLGDSTLFIVNRRERSTAEAKLKLIDTMYEYYLSLGYFKAVTGQLI